jgi:multisubunit Na+/H+ antiporter MnhC subunit
LTLTGLSEGSHNLTVYAADAYGSAANIGASETINFTIAKTEPFPTALVITASGASLAIVAAALLVYFKKRKR